MMTPKQALEKDGTIPVKQGKGRLSREAVDRCKVLAAQGWSIKGYEVVSSKEKTSSSTPAAPVVVKKAAPANAKVISDFVIFWPEETYKAVDKDKKVLPGKWGGMREVCNTCKVSLVQCHCDYPTVHNNKPVSIVRR